tara:strand:+ start:287 stop:607 length:321 start_codon:yes stop_codon:yes gene_type:complete
MRFGFMKAQVVEIQKHLSSDEAVVIWKDDWQFNRDILTNHTIQDEIYTKLVDIESILDLTIDEDMFQHATDSELDESTKNYNKAIELIRQCRHKIELNRRIENKNA